MVTIGDRLETVLRNVQHRREAQLDMLLFCSKIFLVVSLYVAVVSLPYDSHGMRQLCGNYLVAGTSITFVNQAILRLTHDYPTTVVGQARDSCKTALRIVYVVLEARTSLQVCR